MNLSVRTKLSVMMFLEFAIWGAWWPVAAEKLGKFTEFDPWEISAILNTFAIASILAIFFSNEFADRRFSAEKFLGFSQLIGGLAIIALPLFKDSFWLFFGLTLVHAIFYVPTLSITNTIGLAGLKDPQKDFGFVRLWGSVGWIAVSFPIYFFLEYMGEANLKTASGVVFVVAGICSLALAGFSLVLPHTPPKPPQNVGEKTAWLEALKLLKQPFLLTLFIVTFVDSAIHQCHFFLAPNFLESIGIPSKWLIVVMNIGTVCEVAMMYILGTCLKRLGWRTVMMIGSAAYALRFFLFAFAPFQAVALPTLALHGVAFAFFFAALFIFVGEFFPKNAQTSAQGLFTLLFAGIGPFAGNNLGAFLKTQFTTGDTTNYTPVFMIPAIIAALATIAMFFFFRPPQKAAEPAARPVTA